MLDTGSPFLNLLIFGLCYMAIEGFLTWDMEK